MGRVLQPLLCGCAALAIASTGAPMRAAESGGPLVVSTVPPGAAVAVDGERRGETPLSIDDLTPGPHRVTVAKDGYLENGREIDLPAGERRDLRLTLVRASAASGRARARTLVAAAGGAAVGILGAALVTGEAASPPGRVQLSGPLPSGPPPSGENQPPFPGTIRFSQAAPALASFTELTFVAEGASDPDGDGLVYDWSFGDGFRGQGTPITHVYELAGNFTVGLSVTDGRRSVAAAPVSVLVEDVAGTWVDGDCVLRLTQRGEELYGTYRGWGHTALGGVTKGPSIHFWASCSSMQTDCGYRLSCELDATLKTCSGIETHWECWHVGWCREEWTRSIRLVRSE